MLIRLDLVDGFTNDRSIKSDGMIDQSWYSLIFIDKLIIYWG